MTENSPQDPQQPAHKGRGGTTKEEMARRRREGKSVGGRPKVVKNKKTIEKMIREKLAAQREEMLEQARAEVLSEEVAKAKVAGVKPAKDVLEDLMRLSMGLVAIHQPARPSDDEDALRLQGRDPNYEKFRFWFGQTKEVASALAPFQSPRFSAVMVGQAQVSEITIEGGLPDAEDGGLVDAGANDPHAIDQGGDPALTDRTHEGAGQAAEVSSGTGEGVPGEGQAEGHPVRKALG